EEDIGPVIDDPRIVRRNEDGGSPLKAIFEILCAMAGAIVGIDADVLRLARAVVVFGDVSAIFAGVDSVWIGGIGCRKASFTAADRMPMAQTDAGRRQTVAGAAGRAEVLHGA